MTMHKLNLISLLTISCMVLVTACGQETSQQTDADADSQTISDGVSESDTSSPRVSSKVMPLSSKVGDSVVIEVNMENFPATEGGGINVSFNPDVIHINSIKVDDTWDFAHQAGVIDNQAGTVTDILFSSFASPGGSINIATINATVVGTGASPIAIIESNKNPFAAQGARVVVEFEANTLQIN